ncbi:MAG: ATP synthase subunit I [Synechococcaceae cyanobacterium]
MPAAPTTATDDAVPATPADGTEAHPAIPSSPADGPVADNGMEDYRRLQRRLLLATGWASAIAVPVTALVWDPATAASVLVGTLAGLLYLRLLARSVSRLGVDSKSVGKVQLLVPITLVLAAARIPQLQMLPALLGFLLYKPALILQAVLDG